MLSRAIDALIAGGWSVVKACAVIGVPRSSWYYRRSRGHIDPEDRAAARCRVGSEQPAALSSIERDEIVAALQVAAWAHLSVKQVYWRAFDEGRVGCSQRTFYRVAHAAGLVGDRRRGNHSRNCGRGPGRPAPVAAATTANELWSWDITELRGPGRERYQLMLVVDVFSRYPIAHRVERSGATQYALEMFAEAFTRHGHPRLVHSDNGCQMRSQKMADLLATVTTASFSRPRVSDDNPFSEALFKTIKYDLSMPDRFDSLEHARQWTTRFLRGYATEHRHSGIGHYTPQQVFTGAAGAVQRQRQARLDQMYHAHPQRFRKPPLAPSLPGPTGINLSKAA